ncbi:hypothetical protein RCMRWORF_95 [Rhodobacter phage RcMrWorf]|nr:hypothetical protein RCMRWORF_95 [Rhodobacter phage RcMrWorf]
MSQKPVYFRVMVGLPDCIPNSCESYCWETRRDMVQAVSHILDFHGFSARARRAVNLVDLWRYLQKGGKRGGFVIRGNMGNPCNAEFHQITESEYLADCQETA